MDFVKVLLFIFGVGGAIALTTLIFILAPLYFKLMLVSVALLTATIKLDDIIH